jgi:hypothetical protein
MEHKHAHTSENLKQVSAVVGCAAKLINDALTLKGPDGAPPLASGPQLALEGEPLRSPLPPRQIFSHNSPRGIAAEKNRIRLCNAADFFVAAAAVESPPPPSTARCFAGIQTLIPPIGGGRAAAAGSSTNAKEGYAAATAACLGPTACDPPALLGQYTHPEHCTTQPLPR